jgi:hypothetical protein
MSAIGGKADISVDLPVCLLLTQSGRCPFRKFHPAQIRIIRQNHSIILGDVCGLARAWNVRRRPIQVAVAA